MLVNFYTEIPISFLSLNPDGESHHQATSWIQAVGHSQRATDCATKEAHEAPVILDEFMLFLVLLGPNRAVFTI
jgi:hypothetical protein